MSDFLEVKIIKSNEQIIENPPVVYVIHSSNVGLRNEFCSASVISPKSSVNIKNNSFSASIFFQII